MKPLSQLKHVSRIVAITLISLTALLASTVSSEASWGYRTTWVPVYRQLWSLDCEAAALQMALAHERIYPSQYRILQVMNIDWRQPVVDGTGFHWGDPYTSFVGKFYGSEIAQTGYGVYSPEVTRVARAFGAGIISTGEATSLSTVYWALLSGHPVVAWVSFDWRRHYPTSYVAFDGVTVPYGSPYEHAVTLYGITPGYVLVNNPEGGVRQWISKSTFAASFATFRNMAIIFW